jgi:hypothetical protein
VEKAGDLEEVLNTAFAQDGPALADVVIAQSELSLPPKLTGRSRVSPDTRPEPSCRARAQSSSNSPKRTCVSWRLN